MMRLICLFCFSFLFSVFCLEAQNKIFTKEELTSDLLFLKAALEKNHPNLYTYSSRQEIEFWFEDKIARLAESTNEQDAYELITSFSSVLKDGHSYIYPSAQHLESFFSSAPLFPLDVFWVDEKLVVVGNYSREQNIPLGATLHRINGLGVQDIQQHVVAHTCRDGNNLAYPEHLFYKFFPAYYSFFYGFVDSFSIEYIGENGELAEVFVQGLNRQEIQSKRGDQSEVGISLNLMPSNKSAVLSIKSFDVQLLRKDYHQNFKVEVKKAFKSIEDQNIKFVAIDLRDNQGGNLSNGIFLLQHIMKTNFKSVEAYYRLKNGELDQMNNRWDESFTPRKKAHFDGEVFLFINGGSYSCSAIVANTFKENNRGKIIGEMSGGSAYVNSGAPNEVLTLPNTLISFTIPKTKYQLRSEMSTIQLGVVPDIVIQDSSMPYLQDECLQQFLELTRK